MGIAVIACSPGSDVIRPVTSRQLQGEWGWCALFLSCPEGVRVFVLGLCCVKEEPFVGPCRESCR